MKEQGHDLSNVEILQAIEAQMDHVESLLKERDAQMADTGDPGPCFWKLCVNNAKEVLDR